MKWADQKLDLGEREARLICRALLPKEYTVVLHANGKAKAFNDRGEEVGGTEGNAYHLKYGSFVTQIDPGTETTDTLFLNVLTALDGSVSTVPRASFRWAGRDRIEVKVDNMKTVLQVPGAIR